MHSMVRVHLNKRCVHELVPVSEENISQHTHITMN